MLTYQGNTLVDIEPRISVTGTCQVPLYRRDAMKTARAPMKRKKCFVADRVPLIQ